MTLSCLKMDILTCKHPCIFTGFYQCWLDAKNLDFLVLLIKNWHYDPRVGIEEGPRDMVHFGEVKENLLDILDVKFIDTLGCHVKECSQDWEMFP